MPRKKSLSKEDITQYQREWRSSKKQLYVSQELNTFLTDLKKKWHFKSIEATLIAMKPAMIAWRPRKNSKLGKTIRKKKKKHRMNEKKHQEETNDFLYIY